MERIDLDNIVTDTGYSYELNLEEWWKRIEIGKRFKGGSLPYSEIVKRVKKGFTNAMSKAMASQEREFSHFKGTWKEPYFNHKIDWIEKKEMLAYDLYLFDSNGNGFFNKGEILALATDLMKREGHTRSIASQHAWFMARYARNIQLQHTYIQHIWDVRFESAYIMAENRRREWLPPTESNYHFIKSNFHKWEEVFNSLICEDEYHAPRDISQHWVCNIGNRFTHQKYGVCEVTQHKYTPSKGWQIVYTSESTGKSYPMDMNIFKDKAASGIFFKDYTPINPECLEWYGNKPVFIDPDWGGNMG